MIWNWRLEEKVWVLAPDELPPELAAAGFAGRRLAPAAAGPSLLARAVRPRQVHGAGLRWVEEPGDPADCDAVRTRVPGLVLTVRTADCVPLLMSHPRDGLAAVHAGWRGLDRGVVEAAAASFSDPSRVRVLIGPSIGICCYEVGEEVAERFPAGVVLRGRGRRPRVDLAADARRRLAGAGVDPERISPPAPCTRCHQHLLHSHRGSGDGGRIVAFAALAGQSHAE